jgi:hypothetical protein
MPYQPIPLGGHVTGAAEWLVREVIDPFLSELHFLLTVHRPDQTEKGSLQRQLVMLLLAATDGAAQLLYPDIGKKELSDGERFKAFVRECFPWDLHPPDGLSVEAAINFLWDEVRCSALHRFGLRFNAELSMKFGRVFTQDDEAVTELETCAESPPGASLRRNDERTVLWIDPFYWSLRQAIGRALSTKESADAASEWIKSGQWDKTERRRVRSAKARSTEGHQSQAKR